jgi:predicted Zn-dependent protease
MNVGISRSLLANALSLVAMLSLTACVAPTTDSPDVTRAELIEEARAQERAAKQAPLNFNDKKPYGHRQVEALAGRLAPIASRVTKASAALCRELGQPYADVNCQFQVILDPSERGLNAHADGQNVTLYPAMVDFAKNDTHLAFVIAHEFAHNIMRHVDAQRKNVTVGTLFGAMADIAAGAAGANTQGMFSKVGQHQGVMRYSSSFESEADYVGLYILARAGFAIEQAPDFWRIMSQASPDSIYISQSHPTNPARTIAMGKTVAEIRGKQRGGQRLIPNILRQAS